MTRQEFDDSLSAASPPADAGLPLSSLWWISRNQWQKAHDLIDQAPGSDCAWVHAHLHRIEGDDANASYWYRRAGREKPNYGLVKEREVLLEHFLSR
ncbi:hypothetical protein GGR26_002772 [Lewinella marina]|uniref:Uncharacterized protein n=1 Tax=Neolewinella marina TaxID=438751 RepID=A0A2G0CCV6_9BACT|nr:hypothetical protein [Neolewinella marina]NJB86995.1 hypothetical protein [Neolewinella marina]PHK97811.1 hypothetical protein CGL56_13425 [Neolewinella marina]